MGKNKRKFKNKEFSSTKDGDIDYDAGEDLPKKWYEEVVKDPKKFEPVSEQILIELKEEAKKCHDSEVANYNIKKPKHSSDHQWMKTVMIKGTVSDKIAAYVITIQDNPVYNLDTINKLLNMVKVGKKKECVAVIETLTELFLDDLLRPNTTLKPFHERPLSKLNEMSSGNAITRRKLLSVWYFEDQLKEAYTSFVLALNKVAHDTVDTNKEKAISAMYKLLAGNPEQEKNLLAYIVNKLGDPSQKVASKAIYCLSQLLFKNPTKQGVVLDEVEKLLFRSNISSRAQYYGLCFLSQYYLSHKASDIARKLIEVYFAFFKACVKKGEVDSRMMSALLMGVNRAYPYAKLEMDKIREHIDTMYRIVHISTFNVSMHALSLLFQVSDHANDISDRFYSALYKKLLDPRLITTTHQAMALSLVFKAMVKDKETSRIRVFIKRLLQIALNSQPNLACGILFIISQIMSRKPGLEAFMLKESPLSNFEDDNDYEEKYVDVKQENDEQNGEIHDEVKNNIPELNTEEKPTITVGDDDDEAKPDLEILKSTLPATSWYHCNNNVKEKKFKPIFKYDPMSRNPLYAGGEYCAYTELLYLKDHSHPTISLYASNIMEGQTIKYSGDPLKDFTIIRFLDRFAFKNPKKPEESQGAHPTFGKRKTYKATGIRSLPINSGAYLKEDIKNIPVDEMFMYTYLQRKYANRPMKEEDDSDIESVQSDEFEEMLDNMGTLKDVDDELDYMNDIGNKLQTKGSKTDESDEGSENEGSMDELSEDEIPDDVDDEDEDGDFGDLDGGDENMDDLDEEDDDDLLDDLDDDEEDIEFGSSDEEEPQTTKSKKHMKIKDNKSTKKKNGDVSSLFSSADEFATLLEDEGSSKMKPGSSNVFANADKASMKQLAWEEKRNQWLHGYNKAIGKGKQKKNFGKKRPYQNGHTNKNKKRKMN